MSAVTKPNSPNNFPRIPNGFDRYVVIHIATTSDEHSVSVTKDSAEVIEIGWILLDANTCEELHRDSVLVKPADTPITPLCTSLTTLTWDHVRTAGSFLTAIKYFDHFAQEHLLKDQLSFCFVAFDAWDLRVQLPREARDKSVALPAYLSLSCTFGLRSEYQRWQQHHPESLSFSANSLSNICAALEVEPVQGSAPIKHNLPFHLHALAPASPRRAIEEAVTLARVLRGLIRKSQPLEHHSDILMHPFDASADVKAFQNERSQVLYLSGLPHDTTQSELESWFTQFGGRPIAFWTLRTPDQHRPTGTGFAAFSSHEEAVESLYMNGRALSEKAIEVSPSSSAVLKSAEGFLVPFPPSKNRPRPGDWTCPSCGFSNFQRRTQCFRCSFNPHGGVPSGPHDGMGFMHGGFGYPPHGMVGHHHHGPPGGNGGMHPIGGRPNPSGSIVPFRAGDWKCGANGCNYHNFAKNVSCLRCGSSRASATIISDGPFGNSQVMNHGSFNMPPPLGAASANRLNGHGPMSHSMNAAGPGHGPSPFETSSGFHTPLGQPTSSYPSTAFTVPSPYSTFVSSQVSEMSNPSSAFDNLARSAFASAGQSGSNGNNNNGNNGGSNHHHQHHQHNSNNNNNHNNGNNSTHQQSGQSNRTYSPNGQSQFHDSLPFMPTNFGRLSLDPVGGSAPGQA